MHKTAPKITENVCGLSHYNNLLKQHCLMTPER